MAMNVLAQTGHVSWGIVLLAPLAAAAALVLWLKLTRGASHKTPDPDKYTDQDNRRGPEQGGYYRYQPGFYSHTNAPGETRHDEENR